MEPITFTAYPLHRVTRHGIAPPMDLWNLALVPTVIILGWTSLVVGVVATTPLAGYVEGNDLGPLLFCLVAGGGSLLGCALWIAPTRRLAVRADPGGLKVGQDFFPWASTRCEVEEMELLTDTGEPLFKQRARVLLIDTGRGLRALVPRKTTDPSLLDRIARLSKERSDSPTDVPQALGVLTAAR